MTERFGDAALAGRFRAKLRLPVIVAPMFLVSGVDLVVAASKAGVVGALPSLNARTSEGFGEWLTQIEEGIAGTPDAAPYAVNLIVHSTNTRLEADLDLCVKHEVPLIVAAVGSPRYIVEKVHGYGGLVFCDAASVNHARRAAESGVDGLILLCAGAGGNTGWLNPFAFVSEVRAFFDGPIIVAGAISRGQHIRALEVLGAEMAIIGTSFIAARESMATDNYRDMLIDSNADDIILSAEVTGLPANLLRKSLEQSGFTKSGERKGFDLEHEFKTLTAWRDIWSAGHGVGDVAAVESVAEIVARFRADYEGAQSISSAA